MKTIKVLGFDPSLTNWGSAIGEISVSDDVLSIIDISLISTSRNKNRSVRVSSDRLARARTLCEGIINYATEADVIFSEIPTGSQSAVSAFGLGIVTGILSAIKTPIIQVLPHETKIAAVGSKTASKQQMIDWAVELYPNINWPMRAGKPLKKCEHIADAIAVIHAGIETDQFKQIMAMRKSFDQ